MIGRAVIDRRGGRPECWVLLPKGVKRLVQVPDSMRKAVVFLYCRVRGELRAAGTAFFVGWPVPEFPGNALGLLVTAHHVIAGIRGASDDGKALLRLNTKVGGATWAESSVDHWYQGDPSVDCAVLPWVPDPEMSVDYVGWHIGLSAATNAVIEREGIGLGDEVFMVGLFRNHLGRDRNEPIIRVGNIAAMPTDPIKSPIYGDMRAILIEARSIGGLSGSPVFVHLGFARWREGQVMQAGAEMPFFFLGLMHGHWELPDAGPDRLLTDEPGEKINSGIGVVVPTDEVMRSIHPFMEEVAEVRSKQLAEENHPFPDSSLDEGKEFERFEDLARKLIQVPKKELDEKRKESGGQ